MKEGEGCAESSISNPRTMNDLHLAISLTEATARRNVVKKRSLQLLHSIVDRIENEVDPAIEGWFMRSEDDEDGSTVIGEEDSGEDGKVQRLLSTIDLLSSASSHLAIMKRDLSELASSLLLESSTLDGHQSHTQHHHRHQNYCIPQDDNDSHSHPHSLNQHLHHHQQQQQISQHQHQHQHHHHHQHQHQYQHQHIPHLQIAEGLPSKRSRSSLDFYHPYPSSIPTAIHQNSITKRPRSVMEVRTRHSFTRRSPPPTSSPTDMLQIRIPSRPATPTLPSTSPVSPMSDVSRIRRRLSLLVPSTPPPTPLGKAPVNAFETTYSELRKVLDGNSDVASMDLDPEDPSTTLAHGADLCEEECAWCKDSFPTNSPYPDDESMDQLSTTRSGADDEEFQDEEDFTRISRMVQGLIMEARGAILDNGPLNPTPVPDEVGSDDDDWAAGIPTSRHTLIEPATSTVVTRIRHGRNESMSLVTVKEEDEDAPWADEDPRFVEVIGSELGAKLEAMRASSSATVQPVKWVKKVVEGFLGR
ncbi:hypothetical protein HDU97_000870 [Phlyctochytrium planicorne]|nr:hypothetical protein HDU97_000870 [Phlyctochytrium planicorne]